VGRGHFWYAKGWVVGHWLLLKFGVRHECHGHHRRRHRHFVCAHRRLAEMAQRDGLVVPLHEVANQRHGILRAVGPIHEAPALRRVDNISEDDVDGHTIAKRVVYGHRGVLRSHRAVHAHEQRLAFDLGVAVAHPHGRLFMAARDEFRRLVIAIIDDRLMQAAKCIPWVGAYVFESDRLDHVDHEIRAGTINSDHADIRGVYILHVTVYLRQWRARIFRPGGW
jgi:hypothetical protein